MSYWKGYLSPLPIMAEFSKLLQNSSNTLLSLTLSILIYNGKKKKIHLMAPFSVFFFSFFALCAREFAFCWSLWIKGMAAKMQVTLSGVGPFKKQRNLILPV